MAGRKIGATELKAEDLKGKKLEVKYEANGVDQWQLFFDGEKLHLIATDCVRSSLFDMEEYSVKGTQGEYAVYIASREKDLIDWLKDPDKWEKFASGISGAKAVGGPTLEQFFGCWNAMNQHSTIFPKRHCSWIDLGSSPSEPFIPHRKELCPGYWLASIYATKYAWYVDDGYITTSNFYTFCGSRGSRPLVTPPADIGVQYDEGLKMWLLV